MVAEGQGAGRKIDGHCHCGEIAFEAEVDPDALMICHCTDCQMITGSAFRANIAAPAEQSAVRFSARHAGHISTPA
jgi:hypothetical protein